MAAGAGALLLQPGAVLDDVRHGLVGVPGQLKAAAGDVGEALQAESPAGAAHELAEAVEKAAGAAEMTVGAVLLTKGGAKVVREGRSAGRTRLAAPEGKLEPRPPVKPATSPGTAFEPGDWAEQVARIRAESRARHGAAAAEGYYAVELPEISPVAPDVVTKGVHIKVGGVELSVRPGQGGTVVFKPVFSSSTAAEVQAAVKQAEIAMQSAKFRAQLHRTAERATDYLRSSDLPGAAARSGETRFLMKALEKVEEE
jgi:hypothetical protein